MSVIWCMFDPHVCWSAPYQFPFHLNRPYRPGNVGFCVTCVSDQLDGDEVLWSIIAPPLLFSNCPILPLSVPTVS